MEDIIISHNLSLPPPPGQVYIDDFPVYDIVDNIPSPDTKTYRLKVFGEVENPLELSWEEILRLPAIKVLADFHCVTGWSKKKLLWEGVSTKTIASMTKVKTTAIQVMAFSLEGYTTNIPVEYFTLEDSLIAYKLNGSFLSLSHGAPLRLVIPMLYSWKSAKYLAALEFQNELKPGFWELRGYHLIGDPWEEERYSQPIEEVRKRWSEVRKTKVERYKK